MKATFATVAAAVVALSVGVVDSAVPTKFTKEQWKYYHCLTLEKYLTEQIVPCTYNCLAYILDGHM